MRIAGCKTAHYRIPRSVWWPVALEDHALAIDAIELVTCDVETDVGITGRGYTYTLGRGGSAVHALLQHEVAPQLAGQPIRTAAAAWDPLWAGLRRVGRGGVVSVALCAADIALWDALAQAAGLPLYEYLGKARDRIPAYGSSIDLGYALDELTDTVRAHVDAGLEAVKVKVGRSAGEDLRRVQAVREVLGAERQLMVDANAGWKLREATERARLLEPFHVTWLEEPLDPDDLEGHARLKDRTSIGIAAGETLFSVAEFDRYLRAGALRYVQADVARVGGITPWLRVAELARAAHRPMAPPFMQDVHVHLVCAVPNGLILEYLPLFDALLEAPLEVSGDGTIAPPRRPGVGVRFRTDVLEPYRVSGAAARIVAAPR